MDNKELYTPEEFAEGLRLYKEFWHGLVGNRYKRYEELMRLWNEIPENVRKILDPKNQLEYHVYDVTTGSDH